MKATGPIIAGLLALSYGSAFAETASELIRSPEYQDHQRALALLDSVPGEIRSCVGRTEFRHMLTEAEVKSRVPECQRIRNDYLLEQVIRYLVPVFAAVISLALTTALRRRIAALLYNLFVGILAFAIRVKRFFDHAIKEAADRTH